MSPDPQKVAHIKLWPVPANKQEVKSFLQTVQFCSPYMFKDGGKRHVDVTAPLRELTKDNVHFQWTGECQQSFTELKSRLTEDTGLVNYDPDRETRLYMDQGPVGIASTIAQKYNKGGEEIWKAVYHNGRRLERAEERYHKIEGESLAIYSRIKMNSRYLHGTTFTVMTDHAALLPLYNKTDRPAPARVERHRSRLRGYDFNVDFCPGEKMPCDYSSRHLPPFKRNYTINEKKELGIEQEEEDAEVWINRISETFLQAITTRQLQEETERDPELSGILRDLQTGMKSKNTSKGPYYEELQEWNRIVRRGTQVVMHKALQPRVIALTHEGHQSAEKTPARLRETTWFRQMHKEVNEFVDTCNPGCAAASPHNPTPPMQETPTPEGPWEICYADFKGPIGTPGWYVHTIMDAYSRRS